MYKYGLSERPSKRENERENEKGGEAETCAMIVPKREAANRKRKMQYTCKPRFGSLGHLSYKRRVVFALTHS